MVLFLKPRSLGVPSIGLVLYGHLPDQPSKKTHALFVMFAFQFYKFFGQMKCNIKIAQKEPW